MRVDLRPAIVLALLGYALLTRCDARVRAQEDAMSPLALAVAQVAMNEAPGFPADLALIAQATLAHGDTDEERLAWLRSHSSCVLGLEEPARMLGNCSWTRELRDDDAQPASWPSRWVWARHVATWRRTREHAARLMSGGRPSRGWPCASAPDTWGSRTLDAERALSRGMVPLDCRDPRTGVETRNQGFLWRARRPR